MSSRRLVTIHWFENRAFETPSIIDIVKIIVDH